MSDDYTAVNDFLEGELLQPMTPAEYERTVMDLKEYNRLFRLDEKNHTKYADEWVFDLPAKQRKDLTKLFDVAKALIEGEIESASNMSGDSIRDATVNLALM
jgi:hypothetical protein